MLQTTCGTPIYMEKLKDFQPSRNVHDVRNSSDEEEEKQGEMEKPAVTSSQGTATKGTSKAIALPRTKKNL
ncbi:hypothetical protein CB1_000513049 [Camelus ferus]|nr:hypothetical protein CB1_000513049 [Camelus ferus]